MLSFFYRWDTLPISLLCVFFLLLFLFTCNLILKDSNDHISKTQSSLRRNRSDFCKKCVLSYAVMIKCQKSSIYASRQYKSYFLKIIKVVWFFLFFYFFNFKIFNSYMRSQTWTSSHLPPHNISLGHPHAPAPSMLYPASDIDWRFDSYMIVYMLECHSPKSSHPLPLVPHPCL